MAGQAAAGGGGDAGGSAAVEEDASDLVFPKEFNDNDTKTLLISEVSCLVNLMLNCWINVIFAQGYLIHI